MIKCEEHLKCILKCAFNVSCLEIETYAYLLKKNPATIEEIAEDLGKDKSTIYKSLQKLLEMGLVERDYRILKSGGYRYLYRPIPVEIFKKKMIHAIEEFSLTLQKFISDLQKIEEAKLQEIIA